MASEKLYVVVRADLPVGLQASQAVHAGQEFVLKHPRLARAWRRASNTVVLVTVPDVGALELLLARAVLAETPATLFRDPDLEPELTAITLGPGAEARGLCRGLPLLARSV